MPKKRVGLTFHLEHKAPPYRAALEAVGFEVVETTPGNRRPNDGLDGLCLSGGADLDPALYGKAPHVEAGEPVRDRDQMELAVLASLRVGAGLVVSATSPDGVIEALEL